MVFVYQAYQTS